MRMLAVVALVASLASLTGCVMAVRQVARESNRAHVEASQRHRFPVGTSPEVIKAAMNAEGYRCLDTPVTDTTAFHFWCGPDRPHRTAGAFLVGGNWRLEFTGRDGRLEHIHASGRRARTR